MSLKIHFLDADLERLPDDCDVLSDEHGECFHQEMAPIEIP